MASAFSHIAIPAVLYAGFKSRDVNFRLFLLGAVCSIVPDADVIAFHFGVPYGSPWAHRGFTHSFAFAFFFAALLSLFYRQLRSKPWPVFWMCFISFASHGMLDAMTNGGSGIAFYWPFSTERSFFPFRPVEVSPIGVASFFSERGLEVIASELVWILIPAFIAGALGVLVRKRFANNQQ